LGVKKKYIQLVKDETERTENKTLVAHMIAGDDELYPLQKYDA
jgi:hypothetical protein